MAGLLAAISLGTALSASGETLLRVIRPDGAALDFDMAALEALDQHTFTTNTIWTPGPEVFSGPSVADILEAAGLPATDLRVKAVNDYAVDLPATAIAKDVPIVALRRGGKPFGVREKGPLWLVFPYDRDDRFQTEQVYAWSVWQLVEIEARSGEPSN